MENGIKEVINLLQNLIKDFSTGDKFQMAKGLIGGVVCLLGLAKFFDFLQGIPSTPTEPTEGRK